VSEPRDAALRPLHEAREAFASLRDGAADPDAEQRALLRAGDALEGALRRYLRSDPSTPLDLRLKALAPDELSSEELISALRQRDLVSIELAAAFHELLSVRRRIIHSGVLPSRRDVELVLQLAGRVEREVTLPPRASSADPLLAEPTGSRAVGHPAAAREAEPPDPVSVTRARHGAPWWWAVVAALAVVIVSLGVWWATARSGPSLDEAIALFRTGDYARAETQFARHAQANPRDPTPRLYLARIYRRSGRYPQAQEQLRQAMESAPEDAALHRELGFLLLDAGQAESAVGRFRTAVELDPESVEGWAGLVRALRESGQHAAADRVIARAPAEARALFQRGTRPAFP
jgi:tetratricopeptide (TPR) repeat protein